MPAGENGADGFQAGVKEEEMAQYRMFKEPDVIALEHQWQKKPDDQIRREMERLDLTPGSIHLYENDLRYKAACNVLTSRGWVIEVKRRPSSYKHKSGGMTIHHEGFVLAFHRPKVEMTKGHNK